MSSDKGAPTANSDAEMTILNLAMLVRRLCRKLPDGDKTREQALDYLKRTGLQGSPLRSISEPASVEGVKGDELSETSADY